jgi:hypothetical protein
VTPEVAAALEAVALRLRAAGVEFLLGGSALLHALGLDVAVRDVDLVVRAEDRLRFEAAAGEWWQSTESELTPYFRSPWKATLDVDGVQVEGLGGLAWVLDGRVVEMPFRAAGEWRCGVATLPLAPTEHWLLLYEGYRPDRAAALAPLVGAEGRERALAELGVQ